MMSFLARRLEAVGLSVRLASAGHLRWVAGEARLEASWWRGPLDLIVRFFPAEWLHGLPRVTGWRHLFAGARTPLSNPATAILTQTKRFPLVWNELGTPLPTWRALLPETRDPRAVRSLESDEWVLKPALGRVGEGVGLRGVQDDQAPQRIMRSARWRPGSWIAQRRFQTTPMAAGDATVFPCLGVYTVDGRVAGAYGRVASVPLIDARAADAAVLAA